MSVCVWKTTNYSHLHVCVYVQRCTSVTSHICSSFQLFISHNFIVVERNGSLHLNTHLYKIKWRNSLYCIKCVLFCIYLRKILYYSCSSGTVRRKIVWFCNIISGFYTQNEYVEITFYIYRKILWIFNENRK